ncbi:MAG TPA: limonene-1,2-epoxide hydrolase family protein, partial [Acidimicrobiia bacterium]|nr:limonene-1,2-epoxide hydrolase family protein [Acidimicrobiia bacterium]
YLDAFIHLYPTADVEILNVATRENVVFTQRRDHAKDAQGKPFKTADVCGVLHVDNRRIARWHDYFDPTPFPVDSG